MDGMAVGTGWQRAADRGHGGVAVAATYIGAVHEHAAVLRNHPARGQHDGGGRCDDLDRVCDVRRHGDLLRLDHRTDDHALCPLLRPGSALVPLAAVKFRWSIAPAQPLLVDMLAAELKVSRLVAACLLNRGHSDPAKALGFLTPRLKDLDGPFLVPNMRGAVDRLFVARERGEPLVIFGDYDVDGV